jgi:molybdopterin synthase sulfur carrier subunit
MEISTQFVERGRMRRFINVYVNNEDIRFIQNLETPLKEGDHLVIIPAIAGGSSKDFS